MVYLAIFVVIFICNMSATNFLPHSRTVSYLCWAFIFLEILHLVVCGPGPSLRNWSLHSPIGSSLSRGVVLLSTVCYFHSLTLNTRKRKTRRQHVNNEEIVRLKPHEPWSIELVYYYVREADMHTANNYKDILKTIKTTTLCQQI